MDRAAIERIIKRAAELQANERDIGDGLTEKEMLQLGQDVGIPDAYLKQAMLEEQARIDTSGETGLIAALAGPRFVSATRSIAGEAARVERSLQLWMSESELLQVRRRFPQQTSWEAKRGAFASLRRAMGVGGRPYFLTQAREVIGAVTPLDTGRCHVRLVADLSNMRSQRAGWAIGIGTAGTAATIIASAIGVLGPVAWIPLVLAGVGGMTILRTRGGEIERVQTALEQILDHLEQGDHEPQRQLGGPRPSAFVRIADELLKNLGPGKRSGG